MYLITWITTHLPTLRDGWLSWPSWLTDSRRLNHKVVTHPASSLAQDRESSPAETCSVLTTMLRRQEPFIFSFEKVRVTVLRFYLEYNLVEKKSICYVLDMYMYGIYYLPKYPARMIDRHGTHTKVFYLRVIR